MTAFHCGLQLLLELSLVSFSKSVKSPQLARKGRGGVLPQFTLSPLQAGLITRSYLQGYGPRGPNVLRRSRTIVISKAELRMMGLKSHPPRGSRRETALALPQKETNGP